MICGKKINPGLSGKNNMANNLEKFFKNKKVLITGHTGFKGGWLTQILFNWSAKIIGISLKPSTKPNLFETLNLGDKTKNYFVDIRDYKKIRKIINQERPEIVFHLAAQPLVRDSYDDPLYTFETNIMGTANLLESIKEIKSVKSAVLITTDKVYEENNKSCSYKEKDKLGGHDPYSSSKAGAEIIISSYLKSFFNPKDYKKTHQTLIASARAGNVVGGGDWSKDRIMTDVIRAIFEKNQKIIIRNPKSIRPWQYVLEPLSGYLLLAKKLYEGKKDFSGAWNFGPELKNCLTVKKLLEESLKILERGSYLIKPDSTKHEAPILRLDITKAKKELNWQPRFNINQTLKLTLDWYKNFYEKGDTSFLTNQQIKLFFKKL